MNTYDQIRQLAFSLEPPNQTTPRIVQLANEAQAEAERLEKLLGLQTQDSLNEATDNVELSAAFDEMESERDALRAQLDDCYTALGTTFYMDPPDGGDPGIAVMIGRMKSHRDELIAQVKELAEALERLSREAPLGDYMQDPADPVNSHFLLEELSHRSDFARAALSHLASADQRTADTSRQ